MGPPICTERASSFPRRPPICTEGSPFLLSLRSVQGLPRWPPVFGLELKFLLQVKGLLSAWSLLFSLGMGLLPGCCPFVTGFLLASFLLSFFAREPPALGSQNGHWRPKNFHWGPKWDPESIQSYTHAIFLYPLIASN